MRYECVTTISCCNWYSASKINRWICTSQFKMEIEKYTWTYRYRYRYRSQIRSVACQKWATDAMYLSGENTVSLSNEIDVRLNIFIWGDSWTWDRVNGYRWPHAIIYIDLCEIIFGWDVNIIESVCGALPAFLLLSDFLLFCECDPDECDFQTNGLYLFSSYRVAICLNIGSKDMSNGRVRPNKKSIWEETNKKWLQRMSSRASKKGPRNTQRLRVNKKKHYWH